MSSWHHSKPLHQAIFPDFNWHMSLYKPSLELPEVRKFRPNFVDTGDGTKKMDPMLACRVVVIKWVAQFTHLTRGGGEDGGTLTQGQDGSLPSLPHTEDLARAGLEGALVREVLYGTRHNVNFVHEVYRQSFLLSFSHSPAMKRVITVYKDWIQMNVAELPPFLLEPSSHGSSEIESSYYQKGDEVDGALSSSSGGHRANGGNSYVNALHRDQMNVRAGLQNVLQLFVTNAANVFLLEVSPEYPILLEEQVEMCKRVLNIYRWGNLTIQFLSLILLSGTW